MKWLLLALVLLAAIAAGYVYHRARASLPRTEGTARLPGLASSVEVLRDAYGIPYVFASSLEDLARANGYLHAQDRFFQMELHRRLGTGTLAALLGAPAAENDVAIRRLGLHRAAEAELERMAPETRRLLEAYAGGVNAYREEHLGRLPPELQLLRVQPGPWQPRDSLAIVKWMSLLLSFNGSVELVRAELVDAFGVEEAYRVTGLSPPDPRSAAALRALGGAAAGTIVHARPLGASNAWVLAGERTRSGLPLLASDPHLPLGIPSVWYEMHLSGGGVRVSGASLPGIPWILIGHNERIAWGITALIADVQDHYVETLHPEDPGRYRAGEDWERFDVESEVVQVAGGEPIHLEILLSRHGRVVSPSPRNGRVVSLRWEGPWRGDSLTALLALNRAGDWDQFTEALRPFSSPPLSFVYADVAGNIGWFPAGELPLRRGFDGTVPVDGSSGRFEWEGFLAHESKPFLFNPEGGRIVSANHDMLPNDPSFPMGRDQLAPFRARRIEALLAAASTSATAEDFARIQDDRYDRSTESILRHAVALRVEPDVAGAHGLLRSWDGRMSEGPGPAVYQAFYHRLLENTFRDDLGDELYGRFLRIVQIGFPAGLFAVIEDPEAFWWDDRTTGAVEDRSTILRKSLREAVDWLERREGGTTGEWSWTSLHAVEFRHPLGSHPLLARIFNRGPVAFGGSTHTIANAMVSLAEPFAAPSGTSFRLIVDLADLGGTRSSIATGASGHPLSPHYFDQNEGWREGEPHPLFFERARIEAEAGRRLLLTP